MGSVGMLRLKVQYLRRELLSLWNELESEVLVDGVLSQDFFPDLMDSYLSLMNSMASSIRIIKRIQSCRSFSLPVTSELLKL